MFSPKPNISPKFGQNCLAGQFPNQICLNSYLLQVFKCFFVVFAITKAIFILLAVPIADVQVSTEPNGRAKLQWSLHSYVDPMNIIGIFRKQNSFIIKKDKIIQCLSFQYINLCHLFYVYLFTKSTSNSAERRILANQNSNISGYQLMYTGDITSSIPDWTVINVPGREAIAYLPELSPNIRYSVRIYPKTTSGTVLTNDAIFHFQPPGEIVC